MMMVAACMVTVALNTAYRDAAISALGWVSAASGVQFREAPDARIRVSDGTPPEGASGWAWPDGTIVLLPRDVPPLWPPQYFHRQQVRLIAHEILHVFGAVHSSDPASIMDPEVRGFPMRFSPADEAFMAGMPCVGVES